MPTRYLLSLLVAFGFVTLAHAAPPTLALSADDEKILKEAKLSTEPAALLDYFRQRTLDAKNLEAATLLIQQLGDDDYFVREKATEDLRKRGASIVPLLRRALADPDEEIKDRAQTLLLQLEGKTNPTLSQAVVRALRVKAPPEAVSILFGYLPAAANEAVEDEVFNTLAILGVKDGKVEKVLEDALKDKQPTQRAAAGLVLGRSGTPEQKKTVQVLLTDVDATVRFRTAQGLLAGHDRAGVPILCALLTDGPVALSVRADELLQCLASNQPPRTPLLSDDAHHRKRSRQIWEEWWRLNNKMDLNKAEIDLAPFNPALRSRALIRQLGVAILQNDFESVKKMVELPFLMYGNQVLDSKEALENSIQNNNFPGHGQQTMLLITGAVSLDKFLAAAQPTEKTFLTPKVKKGEVRAFNVYLPNNPQIYPNPGQEITIFVKTSADQVKIIGFSLPRGPNNRDIVW